MRKLRVWRCIALAITIVTIALIGYTGYQFTEIYRLEREQEELAEEIAELQLRRDDLKQQLETLTESPNK